MSANTLASTSGNIYLQHTTNRIFSMADNFKSPTSRCRTSMPHNPPTLACPHSVPELPANITDRVNSIAYPVPYSIARGRPHGAPWARCIDTLYSFYTPNIRYNVTYLCDPYRWSHTTGCRNDRGRDGAHTQQSAYTWHVNEAASASTSADEDCYNRQCGWWLHVGCFTWSLPPLKQHRQGQYQPQILPWIWM